MEILLKHRVKVVVGSALEYAGMRSPRFFDDPRAYPQGVTTANSS
jgi:hypothetical protein